MRADEDFNNAFWGILLFLPAVLILPVLFAVVLYIRVILELLRSVFRLFTRLYTKLAELKLANSTART